MLSSKILQFNLNNALIEEGLKKRQHNVSNVIIYTSDDIFRILQLLKLLVNEQRSGTTRVFVYEPWSKLHELKIVGNEFTLVKSSLFNNSLRVNVNPSLTQILQKIDELMQNECSVNNGKKIYLVMYNIDVEQEINVLNQFLRYFINNIMYKEFGHTIVIFCENAKNILNNNVIMSSIVVELPRSTDLERENILRHLLNKHNVHVSAEVFTRLVEYSAGFSLSEYYNMVSELVVTGKLSPAVLAKRKIELLKRTGLVEVTQPRLKLSDYAGYCYIKELIMKKIILRVRNIDKAKKLGLDKPKGILLFGPPGCGKTRLAGIIAGELGYFLVRINMNEVFSKYVGETEKNLARLFRMLRETPNVVLLIDEFERLGSRDMPDDTRLNREVIAMFLEYLDDEDRNYIIIGATNRIDKVDQALFRVGRIDTAVPVPLPDYETRLEILRYYISKRNSKVSEEKLQEIAARTALFSCADLRDLVNTACEIALINNRDFITDDDLEEALSSKNINISERMSQQKKLIELARMYCNDSKLVEILEKIA